MTDVRRIWRELRRDRAAVLALGFLGVLVLLVLAAPLIQRYPPDAGQLSAFQRPPSPLHWFGTDNAGRDVWSRMLAGGRVSLLIAALATLMTTAIGVAVGAVAGYYGGLVDSVLMRATDALLAFPQIVLLLMLAAVLGPSVVNVVLIIGLLSWMGMARLVRGQVLSLREQTWVLGARAVGVGDRRLIVRHLLPHVSSIVIVHATFGLGTAIFAEAGLSFLGLGVRLPQASWGNMLQSAQTLYVLQKLPWVWIPPGLAVMLFVLATSYVGEVLRRAMAEGAR